MAFLARQPSPGACRRAIVCLLFTTILCLWNASAAHAQYVQRQVVTTNGAVTFVGNALGLNKDGTNDRPGISGSIGAFITTDTSQRKNPAWPPGTTGDWHLNSSSAVVGLLEGSHVIRAELIWGGSYLFGGEDVSAFLNDPINFTTPAGTTQVTRDPTTAITRSGPQQNYYVRTADVTSLVRAAGNGTYTVGRVPATQATAEANFNAAGWTLAILYENSGLPTRSLSLFLGLEPQNGATAPVSGFCAPAISGKLRARVAVSASGGDTPDPGNTRDSLRFGPSSNLSQDSLRLSGPNNPIANFFASQINGDEGRLDTRGTFGDRNNDFKGRFDGGRQGWDISNVDASARMLARQTVAFAQGTADADDFFINALGVQIDVDAPGFGATRNATSVDRSSAEVGDVLTYTVELDNKSGQADANNVVLTVPLPAGMSFVAGSFSLDGTATGANPITGAAIGTVQRNRTVEATFQLRVDAIPGAPAPARYQVTPRWTYTFVSCSGQTPVSSSFTSNTVTTEIARITASKSASPTSIRPEEILTYTITISNTGTAASRGTLIRDAIPTGTTYQPNSTTLNGGAVADLFGTSQLVIGMFVNSPTASSGVVRPGESAVVKFRVRVNSSATTAVVNTATIEPDGPFGPLPAFPVSVTTPLVSSADLSVSKTGPVTAIAGTNVTYTVTVLNAGPGAANAVSLTDATPPGLTLVSVSGACTVLPCSLGSLADDETRTVSVTYAIPANYSLGNTIVNTATVTTTSQDTFPENNSASASTAIGAPVADLMITNTNGVSGVVVGTTTTYTITVTNAGPSSAANAVVTDTFPSGLTGVSWSCAGTGGAVCGAPGGTGNINAIVTVPVGGTLTFTATGTVDPAVTGTIVNTARVVPAAGTSDPTPAIATDTDPVELRADVSVTETGPATVVVGNQITYTITVHNAGPSAAADVLLEDLVPVTLTFVSSTGPCTAFPCSLGTLAAGATVGAEVTYAVPVSYVADTVVSTARISSSTVDPNESNNASTTTVTVDRNADVEIIKQISPDTTSLLGEDATFFVTVTNHGPAPATGVVVKDLLPAGLALVSAHVSQGSYVPQTGLWTVGTLEDEEFATLTLIATLTVADSITNQAQVLRQNEPDPVSSNNFSSAVLNVAENADVGVDIAVDKPAPLLGENVTFTVTAANRGPSPATGVVVGNLLSAGLTLVSATPSQGTFVAPDWTIGALSEIAPPVTLTIVATVTATGPLFAGATVRQQTEADSNPANNRASVTLNAAESANLKVTKTLTRSAPHVGELLTFNVIVANQGPSPATGVQLTEVLSAGLAFDSASPSQGSYDPATSVWTVGSIGNTGSAGLTITARVTQAGTVTNTASITASDQADPDPADNTSTVTLTTETIADLAVTQTFTGSPVPGLPVTYTIVVTNTGPSPVAAASVSDVFPAALVAPTWTCTADPGSSCAAASGTGNLATTVTLEAGDRATFTVTGVIASSALGTLANTATVAAPLGATDPVPANNTATSSIVLTPSAALQITKAGPTGAVAGTSLVYTITVTNAGPSDASGVTLTDPTPPGLTFVSNAGDCTTAFPCSLGTLPPAATRTITATFAIPSGYTTPNPIANTATVSSATPPAVPQSATTNTPVAAPVTDLHITNTNGVNGVIAGRPTTYTITATNPLGPSDAIGATVTDTFPLALTGVTWTCAATAGGACPASGSGNINTPVTVPVGASVVFTATGTVNPAATGELVNSAQVVPPAGLVNRTSAIATDHDAIATEADVAISKTGPASIVAGNPLVYTITVGNTGPSDAANVVVRDPTPAGLTWVSNAGDCTTAFPCTLGVVPAGATRTIAATFSVPLDYSGASPIANVADASSTTVDTNTANNTATAGTTLNRNADVAITKSVSPASVLVGQPTTFTVVVTNHGPARVTGVVVQDLLPAGLAFASATPSQGSYVDATGAWTIGTLLNAQSATLTLEATVTVAGAITNRALVVAQDQPDPVASNNSAAAIVNGAANADVGVTKTADRPAPLVGETVTFTVTVANAGPSPATGVVVTDALPAGLAFVSATPSQGTYTAPNWTVGTLSETGPAATATLTIVATVTAPGALVNSATITQQAEVDPNAANNSASVTLNAAESANLKVIKTLTRSSPHVGELLTFNVVVTNQGPSPATGVVITEVLSAGLVFESAAPSQGAYDSATGLWTVGSLANAGSAGLTITARVTQAGTVTNTASVTARDQPDPDLTDNAATVTLTTETIADLAITKTLTGPVNPGLATTYSIVVTNLGPSPVTGASVSDVFPVALVAPAWTCTADPGSSCAAASGTGNMATTVTLEAGDRATFIVTGLIAANATGLLVNTAIVTAPAGAVDPDTANNSATSSVTLTPSADLHITKDGPLKAVAGTSIVYTITVTNSGPSDATNVTLADPTPPGLTFVSNTGACVTAFPCDLGTVPAGATRTITATFAIPSGYTTPNPIANTATVSSLTPDAAVGDNSATTNTPVGSPVTDLHITKSNGVNGVVAGLPTTYTITVTNPLGPSDASGATVTDTFPTTLTGVTWTCTGTAGGTCPTSGSGAISTSVIVPVGATVVFTATGTVDPAATGVLVNSAQVIPPAGYANRTSAIATDSDPITARADLGVTKTGLASIVAGNDLVYTITVTNTGPSDAAGVVVSDATPAGLLFVSNAGDCTTAFPCALGVVPAGATRTITATFTVPVTYPGLGPIVNVATVSSSTLDDTVTNNTATAETTLNRNADVAIAKSVSPASVLVGQPATFTVVVTNHGPARVTGLVVQDLLPAGLAFVSATPSQGSYVDATGAWTIGTLLNGQSATLTLTSTVGVAGAITNRALVVAQDQPDPVASNNSAAAIVNGAANADVGVTKTADRPAPLVGEDVTFTVTVTNSGPSPATGVVVTDALPAGLTLVSATPSQGTYTAPAWTIGTLSETGPAATATLTIVATVTAPGALVNSAAITQQAEVDPNAANNSASVTLNAAESANLRVTKALTRSSPHVGELLTFNVIVANQGPSPATGVQVTEVLSAGLEFESAAASQGSYDSATGIWTVGSLANAGSAGLTITARVTQAGTVTNTASVTASDQPDPDPTDNAASVTLTTETIADLAVTKTLTGPAIPGLATSYTIVVTNLGPSPVIDASVSDVFPLALVAPAWTCTADPGSSCAAASGTGNLATTVSLEAGDRATFIVNGVIAANATGLLVNTATVTAPAGAIDGDTSNNTATSSVTLAPSADVQLTKSGPATAVAGTNVVYTIIVTNAGPSDATSVTLADPTPPGLTFVSNTGACTTAFPCDLGTVPAGATRTITATFSIPSGYTTPDPIANTATVSSTTPDAAAGNNSATATTSLGSPVTDLQITKTNGVDGVVAGLPTTYTITVTNPLGPSDASGATVTDTFPTTLTNVTWTCTGTAGGMCPAPGSGNINTAVTVPVGATVVFTATGSVDPAATGVLVNSAQVLPPAGYANRTSAIATDSDPITARADLGITKTGPASIVAGNPLLYTITVTNTGPSDAAGVVVSDATPAGLLFVSNTGDCTTAFPCAVGVVAAGATRTITATFMVPIGYAGLGPIVNVATVSSSTFDDTVENNTATAETTLNRDADVAISKSVSPAAVLVGQPTTFTVVVTNHGPARATGLVVQDLLPAGLAFVSASPSQGSYVDATGAWTIGTLLDAQSATLTLTATVGVAGAITNRALVVAQDQPDPVASNNSAAAIVNGAANADVGVTKTADRPAPLVGETVTFTVTVTNAGPSPATGVVVTDALPAGLTFVSATPSQGTYVAPAWTVGTLSETGPAATATLTIVATVTAAGALVNTATVTEQTEVDPNAANNHASVTLNAAESANLTVSKSLTRSSPHVGELLTFNVIVANQGPSPATGVAITEVLSAGLVFESAAPSQGAYDSATGIWMVGSLANGGSAGLTITARVTQAGTVTNTASVTAGDQPDPDLTDNAASVTLTTETIADLGITKTLTGPAIPGLATTYAIVVTNLGPSPVVGASVSDLFPVALAAPAWTCTADPGSSCAAASGTGNLATTVSLEAGDRATFTVTGLIAANATGLLVNTATVTAPAGAVDGDTTNDSATSSVTLTPSADLQITKAGQASAVAGTNVVYTITVTNAGPSDATSVTLADPTPSGLTFVSNTGACTTAFPCDLGTVPAGATRTITATFAIPSGYTTPNPIANTATVSSTTADAAAGNNSATATTSLSAAVTDLHITKTNGVNGVVAGLPTTYTITVTNPLGPSDATGATVTDTFPATLTGVTWTCAATGGGACPASGSGDINTSVTVPVGASVVFTATATVSPAAAGVLVNSAQVLPPSGFTNRTSAIATDSDPITARADLGITKTGPASIVAGNDLVYTITVTNTGPSDAAGVVVSDATPAGLTFASNAGDCATAFPCALGVVPAGATRTITATFTVPVTYPGLGPIVNVASVSATSLDDTTAKNTATAETTLNRNADVAITKSVSPASVLVGQPTTFTVVVTNHGPARVTGLVVQDLLPAGLAFVSDAASQGSYAEATGAWTIGTLLNAQSATLTLEATVTVAGAITNRALVVAQDQPDPVASNNSAAAIVNGAANADVGVSKIADRPAPLVGETVTFTVTVTNAGPSPATGVVVTDALPAGLAFVSATPSQGTYTAPNWTVGTLGETGPAATATLTIVATVTAPGALVNTATITQQTEVDPNAANNHASVTLNAAESANLTVSKSLTRSSPHVGELLTFNVIVANQGPSPATGVAITEVLSAGLAFESAAASQGSYDSATGIWTVGSIANTGSAGLTITTRVTQAGTVTNTASVTASDQPDPDSTDNAASVTLTTETIADLAITKTLTGSAVPGQATGYTIVVTNTGPSPVTAASVSDLFPVALAAPAWTCTADAGSSCAAASGTGNLATTVSLEAGDRATFIVNGLIAPNATGLLVNTATVTAPAGAVDGDTTNDSATSSVTLTPSADLHITKDGPLTAVVGTNLVYTITVMNAGPSDATGVTLGDPTPPGLTFVSNTGACVTAFPCDLGTVPAGATRTITATFAIPSGYTTPNPIANTATVSSLTPDAATGNNSATTNTPVGAPVTDLHITNTNGVDSVVAGLPTTYTITVTNPLGPSDANGATVIDLFPATLTGVTWTCAGAGAGTCVAAGSGDINTPVTVPVGGSIVFTATGTVHPAATDGHVNSAQVLPPPGYVNRTSAIATDRDAISSEADVAITKTVDQASIVAGNPLVYTITVTNTGPSDAAGVVVSDATPAGLVFVSNAGDCATTFPCALGVVPAGATRTITATFTVPPDYSGPSPIENVTSVSSTTVDTNTANNAASALTTLNREADVEVTQTVASSRVSAGDQMSVTITALNHGPNPATGIEVTDVLPAGFDFVSATASQGAYDPATGAWSVGSLAASETAQLVLTAKLTAPGAITNLAIKTGQNEPDPIVGNDSAAAGLTAMPGADLQVDMDVDRRVALVGETLTFTVRATNRGPALATGVTIADALPAGLSFLSSAPSQGSYDAATGVWTVGTLDWLAQATLTLVVRVDQAAALVNNAFLASLDQVDPNPINNSDARSINASPAADLRVTKAVSNPAPGVGMLVTYTIAVTNLGPDAATSADVSDLLPTGVAVVSATASQGSYDAGTGIWTLGAVPVTRTGILTVTGLVTGQGTLVNTATRRSSTPVDPNAANDTGTATLSSSVVADLSLTKTPSVPVAATGSTFTWTIAVVNHGPSTALGASVADAFPGPFTGVTWTCTASSGSSCTSASGAGPIATTIDLLADGTATFVATGVSAPASSSPLVNVATVTVAAGTTDPDLSNNSATSAVGLVPLADVQVTQTGPSFLAPGTSGDYHITITNVGPSQTAGTTLLLAAPSASVPVTIRGACSSTPCAIGALAPGDVRDVIVTLSPPADYAGPATLVVQSLALGDPFDPRPENNGGIVVTTVTQLADLSITKTGPTTAVPGGRVTYAVTVANAGPSAATGVTVDDPTPAGLTLVSTSGDCTTAFPCQLGTLAPGATRTIAATYTVSAGTAAPPEITNVATVLSGVNDPNPANNSGTIKTRVRSRATCDFDGDGVDEIVTGAGPSGGPHVRVLKVSGGTITELAGFYAYDPAFSGGVSVACGDVTGDGVPEIITGAGPGGGPHVRVFSLAGGVVTEVTGFYAYNPEFPGGVSVAVGDVNGDGVAEIITGAGPGGGPHVRAFSLAGGVVTEVAGFYAYDPAFTGGVSVAAADLTGDGVAEIITGAGAGGGPHVRAFSLAGGVVTEVASFYAYNPEFPGGVSVAGGDVTGDGVAEIITGAGPGGGPHVRAFSLDGGVVTEVTGFYAYDPAFTGGVSVAAGDVNGDGVAEIITGAGPGGGPHVRAFSLAGGVVTEVAGFFAYTPTFPGGVHVAAADLAGHGAAEIITAGGAYDDTGARVEDRIFSGEYVGAGGEAEQAAMSAVGQRSSRSSCYVWQTAAGERGPPASIERVERFRRYFSSSQPGGTPALRASSTGPPKTPFA